MAATRNRLEGQLARYGLRVRGGWRPTLHDALPLLPGDAIAAVVWMVGQIGSECWPAFSASPFFSDGLPDPMDRWSQSIGDALSRQHGGVAIYPSDGPPYAPFQQWANRAEPLQSSPLMLRMHPQWGLWHAYRFALLVPELSAADAAGLAAAVAPTTDPDICRNCDGQPCLHACPVDAFRAHGYDVGACADHLHAPAGAQCMQGGCLARLACPVAPALRYAPAHAAFHMQAFIRRR